MGAADVAITTSDLRNRVPLWTHSPTFYIPRLHQIDAWAGHEGCRIAPESRLRLLRSLTPCFARPAPSVGIEQRAQDFRGFRPIGCLDGLFGNEIPFAADETSAFIRLHQLAWHRRVVGEKLGESAPEGDDGGRA